MLREQHRIDSGEVRWMSENELFPKEVTSNVPRMTLTGRERLHVEQHRGVVAYQADEICFRTACGLLRITGQSLSFCMYTGAEAIISGSIRSVGYAEEGGQR